MKISIFLLKQPQVGLAGSVGEAAGNYYKQREVSFRGKFSNNSLVKLEYYVCKEGGQTCLRVVKNLKFVFTRWARRSHDRVKVKLVEIDD